MQEPKVKWVKSWREIPDSTGNVRGHISSGGTIYAIKGKTSKADVEHEKGHLALGHLKKKTITPSQHVTEEIDATYYAYKNIGQPVHIYSILSAIYNDLAFREYWTRDTTPQKILKLIRNALKRHKIPITWKKDYAKLVNAVRTKEGF